ncbi:MAG: DUF4303 domain-containing protein [Myxococcota bacterium]|nr:DUF4303 domain-containing protein [Myxococcota bacterium]
MATRATKIAQAARAAFEQARREHPREDFYVYALFTETGDDLQPSCHSEQALARRAKALDTDASELRWFAEEFEYHQLGEEHFEVLGTRPAKAGFASSIEALRALDRSGFFGKGKAREAVAVLILRSDQSNREVVELARKLNPRAVWPRIEAAFEVPEPTGKPTFLPGKEVYSIDSLALSADGSTLAAAGWFGGAELLAWRLGRRPRALPFKRPKGDDGFRSIALSPDGAMLFAATTTAIHRIALPRGRALEPIHIASAAGLACPPEHDALFASVDGRLHRWDLASTAPRPADIDIAIELHAPLGFSPDGRCLAGLGRSGDVVILDADRLTKLRRHHVARRAFSCFAIGNGVIAAASYAPGAPITVFSRGRVASLPGHARGDVTSLTLSRDGKRLASAGEDGHVRVFDTRSKKLLVDVRGRQEAMGAVTFLHDGRFAAAGRDVSNGPPVYVWRRPV